MVTQQCFASSQVQQPCMEHLTGEVTQVRQFKVRILSNSRDLLDKSFSGIYNESELFDSLDDILYSVTTYFCDKESCHESKIEGVNVTLLSLHIIPYYPSVKFTFRLANVAKHKNLHTIGINIKPNISCKLYIEDRRRYLLFASSHGLFQFPH